MPCLPAEHRVSIRIASTLSVTTLLSAPLLHALRALYSEGLHAGHMVLSRSHRHRVAFSFARMPTMGASMRIVLHSATATGIYIFCGAHRPEQVMSAPKKTRAQALAQRLSVPRSVPHSSTLPSNAGWLQMQSRVQCPAMNYSTVTHSECSPYTTQRAGISYDADTARRACPRPSKLPQKLMNDRVHLASGTLNTLVADNGPQSRYEEGLPHQRSPECCCKYT